MKRFAALVALISLGGCNSTGTSDFAEYYKAVRQSFKASLGNGRITKDQAAAIPYASMGYRVDGGPEQLIVLATDSNGEQLWTSAAHIVIVTRGGRIVRTVGLKQDVGALVSNGNQQLPAVSAALKGQLTYTRREDFPDMSAYGASITCTISARGMQAIIILGRGISASKVDESCYSAELKWSFTDNYWIDPESELVWRSIQHIHPKGAKIETETLRPPPITGGE